MPLDERLAQQIKDTQKTRLAEGKLTPPDKLQQYYDAFRARFGPEQLSRLDGEALLELMHGSGNRDAMVYWLEFKNDEEFPSIFGSISGGSALKFGVYRSAETGSWMARDASNSPAPISLDQAIAIARQHRDQLLRGVELLQALPPDATDAEYQALQAQMVIQAPDVNGTAWGHKYFSLIFPDKLDDYHVEHYQRFHLIKLLQLPPEGEGRYVCAGHYVAVARELDIPLNHLTSILNQRNGRPYKYWRILANYQKLPDWKNWEKMRDGGFAGIGWDKLGDLSGIKNDKASKDHVRALMKEHYNATGGWPPEIFSFAARINVGDMVLAFEKNTVLGVGRITGDYYFEPSSNPVHRRPVEWLSAEKWETPYDEFSRTNPTVQEVSHYLNQVEAEHRIFGEIVIPPPVPPLDGIPGRVQAILERKGQIILYGPPGTGKTYWAEVTARELAARDVFGQSFAQLSDEQQRPLLGNGGYVRMCSFHPSYGYEDFLEGYHPQVVRDQMTFTRSDGIFKKLCQEAQAQPERSFYLIIDEINRGDIPRIFGELLTLLEKDKRGKVVVLPLSKEPFQVPPNVYLIGTMNTADRSIALLDTALRRRFGFLELMPDYDVLKGAVVEGIPLGPWLEALNRRIVEHVGRDARNLQIGHAYLLQNGQPITNFDKFARVMQEDIIPLLEEYCYEDYLALEKILGAGLVDAHDQRVRHDLFNTAKQDDLIQALLAPSPEITTSIQAASVQPVTEDEEENTEEDENR